MRNRRNIKAFKEILFSKIALTRYLISITSILYILTASACGKVKAGPGARAERVFMDQAGYTCFIIYNDDGDAVGGNCVKD
jgi:hypothetical protein